MRSNTKEKADEYGSGVLTAIRDNSSAYGFSVLITVSLAGTAARHGIPNTLEVLLFLAGAAVAFTIVELLASGMFRNRLRGDPPEVVVLGSAFGIVSISAGFGAAVGVAEITDPWLVWALSSFAAAVTYVLAEGFQIALARIIEHRPPPGRRKRR